MDFLRLLVYFGIYSFAAGCVALMVSIAKSKHLRYVLSDSLLNTALLVGSALLVSPHSIFTVLILLPGVLAVVIAVSSWGYSRRLEDLNAPPKYIRVYPTRPRTLAVVGLLVVVAIQQVVSWRERTLTQTAELLDVPAIEAVAARSPSAARYLSEIQPKNGEPLVGHSLIEACGNILRLAEQDSGRVRLPDPTDKICRLSASYRSTSLRPSN